MSLPEDRHSLIVLLSTTVYGYLPTETDDVRLLCLVRRALEPGGRVVIDQPNHLRLRNTPPARFPVPGETLTLVRSYQLQGYELTTHFEWIDDRTQGVQHKESVTIRLYDSEKSCELLAMTGFPHAELYADFKGAPFDESFPSRPIAVATK